MPLTAPPGQVSILLVEDNPADARLMQEAIRETSANVKLHVVQDGEAAISYLRRANGYGEAARPRLIFLDLNLPKLDGREVLAEIKADEDLRGIPVIVLTTSNADSDIASVYDLRGNCYIRKPDTLDRYLHVIRECHHFWLHVARLPAR